MPEAPQRLKILFLSPRFPYPTHGGDRIKSYHLLKHLARNHDVTFVSFPVKHPGEEDDVGSRRDGQVEVEIVPLAV